VFDEQGTKVAEERNSRKEPFSDAEVRRLLKGAREVLVAKGRKVVALGTGAKPADLKGPSGNYRAPLVVKGKTLLVGFNEDALRELL